MYVSVDEEGYNYCRLTYTYVSVDDEGYNYCRLTYMYVSVDDEGYNYCRLLLQLESCSCKIMRCKLHFPTQICMYAFSVARFTQIRMQTALSHTNLYICIFSFKVHINPYCKVHFSTQICKYEVSIEKFTQIRIAKCTFFTQICVYVVLFAKSTFFTQICKQILICLLYTSDAADETYCVDLGGRRIIK